MFSQQLLQDSSVPVNIDGVEVLVIYNSLFTVYGIENTCGNKGRRNIVACNVAEHVVRIFTLILLITSIVVFNLFYLLVKSLILGTKCVFKYQDLQGMDLKLNKNDDFSPIWSCGSR